LGGFGLELADWLVLRGARKLVLSSRSGVRTGYQSLRIRLWRSYGATVVISLADITTESGVTELLSDANRLGQVEAIFNLAMVSVRPLLQGH
jgi:fatty acid synthase